MNNIEQLLERVMHHINEQSDLSIYQDGERFENYVVEVMKLLNKDRLSIEQTGGTYFPDVVIGQTYGVEIKYSKSNWHSLGNSIFEGRLVEGINDQIYLFFGKKDEQQIHTRYKKYDDVLADIKVTHSPRFYINMDVSADDRILSQMEIDYNTFKELDPKEKSDKIKKFVRSNLQSGEEPWWLDPVDTAAKVIMFNTLSVTEKKNLVAECFTLFPELFSNSSNKYHKINVYLLTKHQVISGSLRDFFSSSGRRNLPCQNLSSKRVEKIFSLLYGRSLKIQEKLNHLDLDDLKEYWNYDQILHRNDVENVWKTKIDSAYASVPDQSKADPSLLPSSVYEAGLDRWQSGT